MTKFVVIVSVDRSGSTGSFGLIKKDDYDRWQCADLPGAEDVKDEHMLMFGGPVEGVQVFEGWPNVMHALKEAGGEIDDLAIAFAY
ncbi:hypothetical protein KXR64_16515 [Brucella intermedia]|uniref:hypothetical protein n=1 Tax=Brucella TaxID=234 RepID=UPI0009464EC2|nr:hypothetical protein [Brucella intermedia]